MLLRDGRAESALLDFFSDAGFVVRGGRIVLKPVSYTHLAGTPSGRGTRKEDDASVGTRNGRLNLKPEGDNAPPVSACRKSPPAAAFSDKTRFPCACGAAGETCKETLLRKASESTAHVAGFGIQLGGLWPSEPFKRVFCFPCRFVNLL